MDTLLQDVRYAFRSLAKTPGFTVVVMVTLPLGIGRNTAVFSVLDTLLLRPLPFTDAERMVVAWAALGLYGVMAYAVTQRTREIGVRIALGAHQPQVLRQFIGEGVRLAAIGIGIGLALSAATTHVAARFLYGVGATDLPTFAASALVLALVAAAASFFPARQAMRVDPVVALRYE